MNPRRAVLGQTAVATLLGLWCVAQDTWPYALAILGVAGLYVSWLLWSYGRPQSLDGADETVTFQAVRRKLKYRLSDHRAMGLQLLIACFVLGLGAALAHSLGGAEHFDRWDRHAGVGLDEFAMTLFVAAVIILLSSATDWYLVLPRRDALTFQEQRYCADTSTVAMARRRRLTKTWYRHRWFAMAAVVIAWVVAPSLLLAQRLAPAQQAGLAAGLLTLMVAAAPSYLSQLSTLFAAMLGQPRLLVGDLVTGKEGEQFADKTYLVHSVSADGLELVDVLDTWLRRNPTDQQRDPLISPPISPDHQLVDASTVRRVSGSSKLHGRPCQNACMALAGECPWAAENSALVSAPPALLVSGTMDRADELEALKLLYPALVARAQSATSLTWSMPAIGITAQAFLTLAAVNNALTGLIAGALSIGVAAVGFGCITLMLRLDQAANVDQLLLDHYEQLLLQSETHPLRQHHRGSLDARDRLVRAIVGVRPAEQDVLRVRLTMRVLRGWRPTFIWIPVQLVVTAVGSAAPWLV